MLCWLLDFSAAHLWLYADGWNLFSEGSTADAVNALFPLLNIFVLLRTSTCTNACVHFYTASLCRCRTLFPSVHHSVFFFIWIISGTNVHKYVILNWKKWKSVTVIYSWGLGPPSGGSWSDLQESKLKKKKKKVVHLVWTVAKNIKWVVMKWPKNG